jgi:phosphomannomutase
VNTALRISHVGLRGIVGQGLTATHVMEFAAAFGTFLEPGRPVVLGRDPRLSGNMIREGVVASLLACGHDVIDLGVVSTPVVQHAIQRLDAAGGIAISASHNTIDWNALRFFGPSGIYLNTAEAGELLDIYHLHRFRFEEWNHLGKLTVSENAIDEYLDGLVRVFDLDRLRPLRVVVDCCNGTSALILRRMNERFGCGFILINERVDGRTVAHTPNTSASIAELQLGPLMQPLRADAGFLFDMDADRVAIADEQGRGVSEEIVLPMLADHLLPRSEGKLIIANLSSTALLEDVAALHGGRVLRVPVGRQAAIDALSTYRPEQIALAGEGTGAVMMPQFRFVYDGIASMLAILTMMRDRGQTVSQILAGYPRHHILKAEVPLTSPNIPALLMELQELFPDGVMDRSDGLRISWPDRWFHVRVSQTEPIIRVIAEQRESEPRELFETLLDRVRSWN